MKCGKSLYSKRRLSISLLDTDSSPPYFWTSSHSASYGIAPSRCKCSSTLGSRSNQASCDALSIENSFRPPWMNGAPAQNPEFRPWLAALRATEEQTDARSATSPARCAALPVLPLLRPVPRTFRRHSATLQPHRFESEAAADRVGRHTTARAAACADQ